MSGAGARVKLSRGLVDATPLSPLLSRSTPQSIRDNLGHFGNFLGAPYLDKFGASAHSTSLGDCV